MYDFSQRLKKSQITAICLIFALKNKTIWQVSFDMVHRQQVRQTKAGTTNYATANHITTTIDTQSQEEK